MSSYRFLVRCVHILSLVPKHRNFLDIVVDVQLFSVSYELRIWSKYCISIRCFILGSWQETEKLHF
jgi:hypothetical protein